MRIASAGYSAGFNQEKLRIKASEVERLLRSAFVEFGTNVVVVSGNSGVSMGYAVLAMCQGLDMQLVLVRKANDGSHGSMIEGPRGLEIRRYIFLDDLIDSGATVRRVNNAVLQQHEKQMGWGHEYIAGPASYQGPEMVAAVMYNQISLPRRDRFYIDPSSNNTIPVVYP